MLAQINPFMLNAFSHFYQLDHSISVLRMLGGVFHLYSNSNRTFCKQTVENLTRRRNLRRLVWLFMVCWCPMKWTLILNRLRYQLHYIGNSYTMGCSPVRGDNP